MSIGWIQQAQAQSSITLYGWTDVGIQYKTKADGQHAAFSVTNYGNLPSEVGLTGVEDLGGGLKALFTLQQGINLNDGTGTVPGYSFFRGSYVGLSSNAGTITIGRQFSVLFDNTVNYDPLYYASYSGQGVIIPLLENFLDDSVKYVSPAFGGFKFEALAATAGVAGDSRAGRVLEAGAQYQGGALGVSAAYNQSRGGITGSMSPSALQTTIATLAATYALDKATFFLGAERRTGSMAPQENVYWGGLRYKVTTAAVSALGIYHTDSKTLSVGHPTLFVASETYYLSKRTSVYLNVGFAKNSGQSSQTVYEYDPEVLKGASQFAAIMGITHTF